MKVLVISHNSFSKTHNNGKTLSAIFSCFKKEELCQLYFTPIGNLDYDRCDQFFLITAQSALRSIFHRNKCGHVVNHSPDRKSSAKRNVVKRTILTHILRDVLFQLSSWYQGGLKLWLKQQKPELVFYVGGDALFSQRIAVSISKKLKVPLITYYTDDYVINPPSDIYVRLLRRSYSRTVFHSSMLFAIGEEMASAYTIYFKKKFHPIMNLIDIVENETVKEKWGDTLKIGYFGGVHLGRDVEIARFAKFVREKLENYLTRSIEITVYTFGNVSEDVLSDYYNLKIIVNKGLTGDDLKRAMSMTDVFLHVESIEQQFISLTMLSVSTKIPEYMGMGKPILAFGPSEVASFKVIAKANNVLVIDDNIFEDTQIKHIASVLDNDWELFEIAKDNYNYAKRNFSKEEVAKNFREKLLSIC